MKLVNQPILNLGLRLGSMTALAGAVLDQEQSSFPDTRLYCESWTMILFNLLYLGPIALESLSPFIKTTKKCILTKVTECVEIVAIHSIIYGFVHRCMHRITALRPIHRFHHLFTKYGKNEKDNPVMPSSANAVSASEFVIAYLSPFMIATLLLRPHVQSLTASITIVSAFNLLVHSEHLKYHSWVPAFVTPGEHLEHHEKRSHKYYAPTFRFSKK